MNRRHKDSQCVIGSDGKWVTPGYILWFPGPHICPIWHTESLEVSGSLHELHPGGSLLPVFADGTSNACSAGHSRKFPQGSDWCMKQSYVTTPTYLRGALICHPRSPTVMMIITFGFTVFQGWYGDHYQRPSRCPHSASCYFRPRKRCWFLIWQGEPPLQALILERNLGNQDGLIHPGVPMPEPQFSQPGP